MNRIPVTVAALLLLAQVQIRADASEIATRVRSILADRCFQCHGPDPAHRKAGLRLDQESSAKRQTQDAAAVWPGDLRLSKLWQRIVSTDPEKIMPPPDSHRPPLNLQEQDTVRDWILSGARWTGHWAFEAPQKSPLPTPVRNPVDAFVHARLRREGLASSQPAPRATLLRRLSFDLTGMPPTPDELNAFLNDPSPSAVTQVVDRLLASPHFGERMAMWWLDAARYSDSDGFQQDETRQNWPWRDWVIRAFNTNMPFDQFTREQFAGDLLPSPTADQILATAFHRNHMTNGEGGRDPEESRVDYVIDRVNTLGTVWLGLTLGCVQCHSHKFDPISQRDYYSLSAFFNSIDEDGRAGIGAKPLLQHRSDAATHQLLEARAYLSQLERHATEASTAAETRFESWLVSKLSVKRALPITWVALPPHPASTDGTQFEVQANNTVQTRGPTPFHDDYRVSFELPMSLARVSGWKLEILPSAAHQQGRFTRDGDGEFILTDVRALARRRGDPAEREIEIASAAADFEPKPKPGDTDRRYGNIKDTLNDDARDGWTTRGATNTTEHAAVFEFKAPWTIRPGDQLILVLRQRATTGRANIGRFRILLSPERGEPLRSTDARSPLLDLSMVGDVQPDKLPGLLKRRLFEQWALDDRDYSAAIELLRRGKAQVATLESECRPRSVMVLAERREPRNTHVLIRGSWDAKGERVEPGIIPAILERAQSQTRTRLDLANWLLDRQNPLTARVVVNHLWQLLFGDGLVRTPEDFGLQGEPPTHPELLDWLAVELMENKWDLRRMIRLIVSSETYQQSSDWIAETAERDPENRLLARAPRFRLPAWMLRDAALCASGLLTHALEGPPTKPWQPDGVWSEITMGRFDYDPSLGPAQHRRTLYAFWRRTIAPTFLFDNAQRRTCEVRSRRTNTPLQALTLLNDETQREAARALADGVLRSGMGEDFDAGASWLGIRILSRPLAASEIADLRPTWTKTLRYYRSQPGDAVAYVTVGQQLPPKTHAAETAAWASVASVLLNLDEALSHE